MVYFIMMVIHTLYATMIPRHTLRNTLNVAGTIRHVVCCWTIRHMLYVTGTIRHVVCYWDDKTCCMLLGR